jgi:hypothetical protein
MIVISHRNKRGLMRGYGISIWIMLLLMLANGLETICKIAKISKRKAIDISVMTLNAVINS